MKKDWLTKWIDMKSNTRIIWMMCLLWIAAGCGGKNPGLDPKKISDEKLYGIGQQNLKDENWDQAREAFKTVFENFPKSDYRILAKIGYADTYYLQSSEANLILAIQEYQDFISLFPFSPKAEYAQFQIGMSYYQMREKPDRDQTQTRKALDEFRKVVDTYPNGEMYRQAYDYLLKCYSLLAEHEYLVARYYQHTGRHKAAVDRLKGMLKLYPESIYQPKYYFDLARSLEELEQVQESCSTYGLLLERWPNSEFTQDAKESRLKVCAIGGH